MPWRPSQASWQFWELSREYILYPRSELVIFVDKDLSLTPLIRSSTSLVAPEGMGGIICGGYYMRGEMINEYPGSVVDLVLQLCSGVFAGCFSCTCSLLS